MFSLTYTLLALAPNVAFGGLSDKKSEIVSQLINKTPNRPNVVWIVSEDNSKHYMRMFGNRGISTPNIEQLAKHGVVFDRAYCNSPVSSAARSTLISGCYGPRLASHYHRAEKKVRMPESLKMFPYYLRKAGYYTVNNAKEDYNIIKDNGVWDESSRKAHWSNRGKNQPFFYVKNLGTTHESCLLMPAEELLDVTKEMNTSDVFIQKNYPQDSIFRASVAYYHHRIKVMDKQVGKIVSELRDKGLLENTIIFYYGDNGGILPDSKGYLTETGLHVPLVAYIPDKYQHLFRDKIGTVSHRIFNFVDFAPSLFDLLDIPIPKGMNGLSLLKNDEKNVTRKLTFGYSDRMGEKYDMVRSICGKRYKYVRNFQPFQPDALVNAYRYKMAAYKDWLQLFYNGKLNHNQSAFFKTKAGEALYDIEKDPYELKNLANDSKYHEVLFSMRGQLLSIQKDLPDLSFYPESYLIDHAFPYVDSFGKKHKKDICQYADVANLSLFPYSEISDKLTKALTSADPIQRFWALNTCSCFGTQAKELKKQIIQIAKTDYEIMNRLKAAEYLAVINDKSACERLINLLYLAEKPVEALYILNTMANIVIQSDSFSFKIDMNKVDSKVKSHPLVHKRLLYVSNPNQFTSF